MFVPYSAEPLLQPKSCTNSFLPSSYSLISGLIFGTSSFNASINFLQVFNHKLFYDNDIAMQISPLHDIASMDIFSFSKPL